MIRPRLKYHLAATLVNNFTNYLFTVAENFCKKKNISFAILQPLMEETVMRMRNISPAATQTGPAIRNDRLTLEKHRESNKGRSGSPFTFMNYLHRKFKNQRLALAR